MSDLGDRFLSEEAGPFDQFDIPEVCAFIHKKWGPDALRELLARPIRAADGKGNVVQSREDWLDISAELQAAGLSKVAAVVDEFAAAALPMTDWSFCCFTSDTPTNRKAWLAAQRQRQTQREEKREQWLAPRPREGSRKGKPAS